MYRQGTGRACSIRKHPEGEKKVVGTGRTTSKEAEIKVFGIFKKVRAG